MDQSTGQVLDYAPPVRRDLRAPCVLATLGVPVLLAAACLFTAFYEVIEEPFFGPVSWRDLIVLRLLPIVLVAGWCGWAVLAYRTIRPRKLSLVILAVGLSAAAWASRLTLAAHLRFERDLALSAEWQPEAAAVAQPPQPED